jgi:hypothetical protein
MSLFNKFTTKGTKALTAPLRGAGGHQEFFAAFVKFLLWSDLKILAMLNTKSQRLEDTKSEKLCAFVSS